MSSDSTDRDIERQSRDNLNTQAEPSRIDEDVSRNARLNPRVNIEENIIGFSSGLATSVLVFTALFSGIIATFLALSIPDLKSPTTPAVVVNILWLLSLVISLSSALNATLFQVYQTTSQLSRGARRPPGAVRKFVKKFLMAQAVSLSIMPLLLYMSFYSFLAGLVIYVWNIYTAAGYCVLAFIMIFNYGYQLLAVAMGSCLGVMED